MSIIAECALLAIPILLIADMILWLRPGRSKSVAEHISQADISDHRSGSMFLFRHGDKLYNLAQVVWFDRAKFEVRLSSGDLFVMSEGDFKDFVQWLDCPPDIKIPVRKWGAA